MLVSSTPDTTNPVSDACETNRVPCISTVALGNRGSLVRGATPKTVYKWTYHFSGDLREQSKRVYSDIWQAVSTDKSIGVFANDVMVGVSRRATGFPAFIKTLNG